MNLEQIALRIADPASTSSVEISMLKELTEKYPYAQLFSILYLKALANGADIQFDDALNSHAYRIGDRMKLYDLIHDYTQESAVITAPIEVLVSEEVTEPLAAPLEVSIPEIEVILEVENVVEALPEVEEIALPSAEETLDFTSETEENNPIEVLEFVPEILSEDVISPLDESVESPLEVSESADVHAAEPTAIGAIISSIFTEIEPIPNSSVEVQPTEVSSTVSPEIEATIEAELSAVFEQEETYDELDIEIISKVVEKVYNENLEKSLPKNEIVEKNIEEKLVEKQPENSSEITGKKSFGSWLKMGTNSPTTPESVEALVEPKEIKESVNQKDELINKFIESEPSISRPKKEFFSPTKKAKESVSEDHMIFTETLANIFAIQGNFPKAIYAYEQLILTNPEKKIFFAQKITELKEKLNS